MTKKINVEIDETEYKVLNLAVEYYDRFHEIVDEAPNPDWDRRLMATTLTKMDNGFKALEEEKPKKEKYDPFKYEYGMNNPVPHVRNYRGRGGVETWGTQR